MWEFPQGSSTIDTTMGDQLGVRGTTNRMLTFNRMRTSQAGVYTCRATIDIQGINSLSRIASQTIQVRSKLHERFEIELQLRQLLLISAVPRPVFSVLPHPTAYNGTNLTITGSIDLDSNVNTPVTFSGMWTGDTVPQVITASPYQIMLSLLPVATDSSGEYTVTYTIRSSDNSPHIIEYNGIDNYNLVVVGKLM